MRIITSISILFVTALPVAAEDAPGLTCEGTYPHHLQGICVDGESIYWRFPITLVKTELAGKLLTKVSVANYHGDLCRYGEPKILLVTDADFQMKGQYKFDCSLGIEGLPDGRLLSTTGRCENDEGCIGSVHGAIPDGKLGVKYLQAERGESK